MLRRSLTDARVAAAAAAAAASAAAAAAAAVCSFAAGGEDMWVHLHSADTGLELETNKGHHGPVHTVR